VDAATEFSVNYTGDNKVQSRELPKTGSDTDTGNHFLQMAPALSNGQVASTQILGDYAIKSENTAPQLDTSQWPLLLKNYDKLLVRSSHFTPIPSGCSPLKRDITNYIKCVLCLAISQ